MLAYLQLVYTLMKRKHCPFLIYLVLLAVCIVLCIFDKGRIGKGCHIYTGIEIPADHRILTDHGIHSLLFIYQHDDDSCIRLFQNIRYLFKSLTLKVRSSLYEQSTVIKLSQYACHILFIHLGTADSCHPILAEIALNKLQLPEQGLSQAAKLFLFTAGDYHIAHIRSQ